MTDQQPGFWARLKQHHIYRVAAWYGATVAVLIQVVARAFPYFGWSAAVPAVIIVLIAGFPVAIVLAWLLVKPADAASQTGWQKRRWKLGAIVTLIVIAAVVASGVFAFRFSERHEARVAAEQTAAQTPIKPAVPAAVIPAKSIAVLQFENLSADKNNEYFSAGMQDLILTKLADIGDLKVISRSSTMQYGSHPGNLRIVGQQLGVATILEGSVQKSGNQVLIDVQLIDANTNSHIWAESYVRTLDNIFGVEGEVAEKIARALNVKLSPALSAQLAGAPTTNPAAYDLFLRAEYQTARVGTVSDTAGLKVAIPLYRKAVAQDPNFALAWARLSFTEGFLAWFGGGSEDVKQLTARARTDAEQAIKLAPDLAAAHIAIGYSAYWGKHDYPAALKAFAAALVLRPNDADALSARGFVERRQGRFEDATASLQQALARDPLNSELAFQLGTTYMQTNRYADAKSAFQHALALDPNNHNAKVSYANAILYSTGDIPRALAAVQGDDALSKLTRVALLTLQRKYQEALTLLDSVSDTPDNFPYFASKVQQQADLYRLMGAGAHARPLYARALPGASAQLKMQQGINLAAVWYAVADDELGLGHTAAGLKAVGKAQVIVNKSLDQTYGPPQLVANATLYAEAHRADLAVPLLVKALAMPGIGAFYSPVLLWLDPAWDPIRHDAHFQALLQQYAKYKPAVTYDAPPATTTY